MKKVLCVFGLFVFASLVWGCQYILAPTEDVLKDADVVFVGKVTNITVMPAVKLKGYRLGKGILADRDLITFQVSSIWKGDVPTTIQASGPFCTPCSDSCTNTHQIFRQGGEYIVFGYYLKNYGREVEETDSKGMLSSHGERVITGVSASTEEITFTRSSKMLDELNGLAKAYLPLNKN